MKVYPNGFKVLTDIEEVLEILRPNGKWNMEALDFLNGDDFAKKITYNKRRKKFAFYLEDPSEYLEMEERLRELFKDDGMAVDDQDNYFEYRKYID